METFLVRNKGNKNIVIDINGMPSIKPNQELDLLEYITEEEIKGSKTIAILIDHGFLARISPKSHKAKDITRKEDKRISLDDFNLDDDEYPDYPEEDGEEEAEEDEDEDEDEEDEVGDIGDIEYILDEDGKLFPEYMPTKITQKLDDLQKIITQLKKRKTKTTNKEKPVCMVLNFQNIDSSNYPAQIEEEITRIKDTYGFYLKNIVLEFQE